MEDLDKLIVAKGFKKLPKYNNSPKLVTLDLVLELQLCQFLPLINSERNGTSVGILSGIVSRIGRWHLKSFDRLNRKEKHFFILFFHSGACLCNCQLLGKQERERGWDEPIVKYVLSNSFWTSKYKIQWIKLAGDVYVPMLRVQLKYLLSVMGLLPIPSLSHFYFGWER